MAGTQMINDPTGIFTRTVARSPVVRHLLHARIRKANVQDVVFVGEDYLHVKEVRDNGHLLHIATKDDFRCRIRSASILTVGLDNVENDPPFIKREDGEPFDATSCPPQLLVLTLDNDQLMFVYLRQDIDDRMSFVQLEVPLPKYEHNIFQPGEHLAIEPRSRAVAVAANERELVVWPTKDKDAIKDQLRPDSSRGNILDPPRYFKINGVITQMQFLIPAKNDPDHIILLLIVIADQKIKAIWLDWQAGTDINHAHVHPPQALENATCAPSLLIPIRNTAFLLVCSHEIKRWRNLLSGSATASVIRVEEQESQHPGLSPKKPLWASWCRPKRSPAAAREIDVIYLAREDGIVYYLEITSENRANICIAGTFGCHVGNAFVSLGDPWLPDVLAMAGSMSAGQVVSIGQWPSSEDFEKSWLEAMQMELVETIPNWSSVTDMVTTSLPHSHSRLARSRDGVFVTAGRQPYGTVTELREGIEAQQVFYIEDDSFKRVTEAWVYSWPATRSMLVVLTDPVSTTFLEVAIDGRDVSAFDESSLPDLNTACRSLAFEVFEPGLLVQVTEHAISVTDPIKVKGSSRNCKTDVSIICAATHLPRRALVTCERQQDNYTMSSFRVQSLNDSGDDMAVDAVRFLAALSLPAEPLCVTMFEYKRELYAAAVFATNLLKLFRLSDQDITEHDSRQFDSSDGMNPASDHIVTLEAPDEDGLLLVCGRRDGRVSAFVVETENRLLQIKEAFSTCFGQASVKVSQLDAYSACLMSGLDTCKISWGGSLSLVVHSVWLTDKLRPEFSQGPVTASRYAPAANSFPNVHSQTSCMVVSGAEIMFTEWTSRSSTVPRQIPVQGSPNRLIYAELERHIVVSSVCAEVKSFPISNSRIEERRKLYPAISFIHPRKDKPSYTHLLETDEVVNALAEWSFKEPREGKVYSFIVVAGSHLREDGTSRGRVTFLQPKHEKREIVGINHFKTRRFDGAVWTVALFDEMTFIIATGMYLEMLKFDAYTGEWDRCCQPFRLVSPAVQVTVDEHKHIHVSTSKDSVMTLVFTSDENDRPILRPRSLGPFAAISLNHLAIQSSIDRTGITVLSTRDQELHGMLHPAYPPTAGRLNSQAIFHARLPYSLLRLRQANTRPPWSPPLPTPHSPIIAATTPGALQILLMIPEALWRRLFWLQRLLEWESTTASTYLLPDEDPHSVGRTTRSLPIGLSSTSTSTVPLSVPTVVRKAGDMHIDGDVLARIFDGPETPREKVESLLKRCAEAQGGVGEWVRQNMSQELEGLDELVSHVKALCFGWM